MREITREQYVSSVSDYEKLYLIEVCNGKVFLCGDIEYGGVQQIPRIEMMYFEMNTSLSFHDACSECRGFYTGGINFVEYNNEEKAKRCAVQDFLKLSIANAYISCSENEMFDIIYKYPHYQIYIIIDE